MTVPGPAPEPAPGAEPGDRTTAADLSYLTHDSTVLRRFTAPGASVNTGRYETHRVTVRDGRAVTGGFDVDVHGFTLARHRSAVTDFTDPEQAREVYRPEVTDLVQELLGADVVVSRGGVLRRSADPGSSGSQPQAGLVHCDYAPEGAPRAAATAYAEAFPDGPGYRRAVASSTWRVFSPPPQDWPLALCDFRSVADTDGLPNTLYFVDDLPADPFGPVDGLEPVTHGSEFRRNPEHRWWYFPGMDRDEVLFFKFHDSDRSRAWRVPHSAFHDPASGATGPRHSIEFRTFAYWF